MIFGVLNIDPVRRRSKESVLISETSRIRWPGTWVLMEIDGEHHGDGLAAMMERIFALTTDHLLDFRLEKLDRSDPVFSGIRHTLPPGCLSQATATLERRPLDGARQQTASSDTNQYESHVLISTFDLEDLAITVGCVAFNNRRFRDCLVRRIDGSVADQNISTRPLSPALLSSLGDLVCDIKALDIASLDPDGMPTRSVNITSAETLSLPEVGGPPWSTMIPVTLKVRDLADLEACRTIGLRGGTVHEPGVSSFRLMFWLLGCIADRLGRAGVDQAREGREYSRLERGADSIETSGCVVFGRVRFEGRSWNVHAVSDGANGPVNHKMTHHDYRTSESVNPTVALDEPPVITLSQTAGWGVSYSVEWTHAGMTIIAPPQAQTILLLAVTSALAVGYIRLQLTIRYYVRIFVPALF